MLTVGNIGSTHSAILVCSEILFSLKFTYSTVQMAKWFVSYDCSKLVFRTGGSLEFLDQV